MLRPRLLVLLTCVFGTQPAWAAPPRVDRHGDSLPPGVIARLGTVRWRSGNTIVLARFLDQERILTLNADRRVEIWDRATGQVKRAFNAVPDNSGSEPNLSLSTSSNTAAFSNDGTRLVVVSGGRRVQLWDVVNGKALRSLEFINQMSHLALSGDGKKLALLARDMSVELYDLAEDGPPRRLSSLGEANTHISYRLTFTPDGQSLIAVGLDLQNRLTPIIRRWDLTKDDEAKRLELPPQINSAALARSTLSNDTQYMACPTNGTIFVHQLSDGKLIHKFDSPDFDYGTRLAFSRDSKLLVASRPMGDSIRIWDMATGKELTESDNKPAAQRPTVTVVRTSMPLEISPDGKTLLAPFDAALNLIDMSGKPTEAHGHRGAIRFAAFDAKGRTVLTAGSDHTIIRWDATSGELLGRATVSPQVYAFAASPDGRWLAVNDRTGPTRVIDLSTGREHFSTVALGTIGPIILFSPDSKLLALASRNAPTVLLYDVATGRQHAELRPPEIAPPTPARPGVIVTSRIHTRRLFFSPDSRTLAVLTGSQLTVWECSGGRQIGLIDFAREETPQHLAMAPDGQSMAIETADGRVSLWEIASGSRRGFLGQEREGRNRVVRATTDVAGYPSPLVFSPDGRWLAAVQPDRSIRLWDVPTQSEIAVFEGHSGQPFTVDFTPDGRRLVSAGADATALIWQLPPTKLRLPPPGKLDAAQLNDLWLKLLSDDAEPAWQAILALAAASEQAIPFLSQYLQPAKGPSQRELTALVTDLNAPRYSDRERAFRELSNLGELAQPILEEALHASPSAETRKSARMLLERLQYEPIVGERLRTLRAIQALELAATPEATELLRELASGAAVSIPTLHARTALQRMK